MFCTNCGGLLREDDQFCINCGAPVERAEEPSVEKPEEPRMTQQKPPKPSATAPKKQKPQKSSTKKSSSKVWLIVILVVVVLMAAAAAAVIYFMVIKGGFGGTEKQVVFSKKDTLYFMRDMDTDKDPIQISRLNNDSGIEVLYWFSEDKKDLYFLKDVNTDGEGTLCKVTIAKLGSSADKNESVVEEIGSKVNWGSVMVREEGLFYKRNNKLYLYQEAESRQIGEDVAEWYVDSENQTIIYTSENGDGTYGLFWVEIKDPEHVTELDDEIQSYVMLNTSLTVYKKNMQSDDDGRSTFEFYAAGVNMEPEQISDETTNVLSWDAESKRVLFSVQEYVENSLYDFVNDPYAEEDAQLAKPDVKNYMTQTELSHVFSQVDFQYYTVEHANELPRFLSSLYFNHDVGMKEYAPHRDGKIYTFYYNEVTGIWYELDKEAYDQVYNAYKEVEDRILLREELQGYLVETEKQTIYSYTYGKGAEPVLEETNLEYVTANAEDHVVCYGKWEDEKDKIDLDQVYGAYDVESFRYEMKEEGKERHFYSLGAGEIHELDVSANSACYIDVSPEGDQAVVVTNGDEGSQIYGAVVSGGEIKDLDLLTEKGFAERWEEGVYYYYSDIKGAEGDFCTYEGGKRTSLIKDVYIYKVAVFDEGQMMGYEDYKEDLDTGDLVFYDKKGEDTKISDDVQSYIYVEDGRIVYLKSGDLWVYRKGENRKIQKGVEFFRCPVFLKGRYY